MQKVENPAIVKAILEQHVTARKALIDNGRVTGKLLEFVPARNGDIAHGSNFL